MNQPPRQLLVSIGKDAGQFTVWTDVPLDRLMKIDGVYDAYGKEPAGPKVIMCDPRYKFEDIRLAIHQLARALEESKDV